MSAEALLSRLDRVRKMGPTDGQRDVPRMTIKARPWPLANLVMAAC